MSVCWLCFFPAQAWRRPSPVPAAWQQQQCAACQQRQQQCRWGWRRSARSRMAGSLEGPGSGGLRPLALLLQAACALCKENMKGLALAYAMAKLFCLGMVWGRYPWSEAAVRVLGVGAGIIQPGRVRRGVCRVCHRRPQLCCCQGKQSALDRPA